MERRAGRRLSIPVSYTHLDVYKRQGQQVGLFGGPLFSIFKALTAVKLAEQATAAGVDCVPIFWLATEDHDLAEVNHVALASEHGLPELLAVESHGLADAPVGTVKFGAEIEPVVARAATLLGDSEVTALSLIHI